MSAVVRATGVAVAMGVAFGLTVLSQVPIASDGTADAWLRLAWRARPERIEHCVTQSPEALAALPPHMRQTTICEGINASYRLEVRHNDAIVAEQHVVPGGLRGDRPLYVFREIALPPGDATIRVTFMRVEQAAADPDDEASDRERATLREAVPERLVWEQRLPFTAGQVRVLSYDPGRRELFEVRPD